MLEGARSWLARQGGLPESDPPASMAVALGSLFLAGVAIGALSLLLPHPAEIDDGVLWSNVALGAIGGIGLLLGRNLVTVWMIQLILVAGTLLVTRAVYYGADVGISYTFWYLWVGVFAFFFLGRRWGTAHVGVIGAAYAWALLAIDAASPLARWAVTLGSIAVVGLLVDSLAGRLRRQTAAADARAVNLEAVYEIARQLATQTDSRAVGRAVCTAALRATDCLAAVLWRPSPGGSGLTAAAAAGVEVERGELPVVTPSSGAIRTFTGAEPRFANLGEGGAAQELGAGFKAGSALWQPVISDSGVVAVLAVYWEEARDPLEPEVSQAVRLLAAEAAIAIERGELLGRLEEAARTDDLTGLPNRRAWSVELARETSRAERTDMPLAVAVLDLDRFKAYNDEHGHQAGDRFLKQVAGIWSAELRATDILARHGGEEFVLAMPGADLEAAERMLERLREAMPGDQTVSVGVCLWDGSESADALVARADAAQYEAKAEGRNRIVGA